MELSVYKKDNGLPPILCRAESGAAHHHYFGCPKCGFEVGGFVITGGGTNDWHTHTDKFCSECGQKIDWRNVQWLSIYQL